MNIQNKIKKKIINYIVYNKQLMKKSRNPNTTSIRISTNCQNAYGKSYLLHNYIYMEAIYCYCV